MRMRPEFNLYSNTMRTPVSRPVPNPISPLGGPFRRWHLTPWQRTEASSLLDDYSDADAAAGLDPSYMGLVSTAGPNVTGHTAGPSYYPVSAPSDSGIFNTLIGGIGQILGFKSGGVTVAPRPGQIVNSQTASFLQNQNTTQMLTIGAVVLGGLWLISKGRK